MRDLKAHEQRELRQQSLQHQRSLAARAAVLPRRMVTLASGPSLPVPVPTEDQPITHQPTVNNVSPADDFGHMQMDTTEDWSEDQYPAIVAEEQRGLCRFHEVVTSGEEFDPIIRDDWEEPDLEQSRDGVLTDEVISLVQVCAIVASVGVVLIMLYSVWRCSPIAR